MKPNYIEKLSMNIVYQIGDLLEAPVEKRQATNDQAIDFVMKLLDGVLEEQAAGFLKELEETEELEYGEDQIHKVDMLRDRLREQLKGMRGK